MYMCMCKGVSELLLLLVCSERVARCSDTVGYPQALLSTPWIPSCLLIYLCDFAGRLLGIFWKAARIGERLSPWVSGCCVAMAISVLFFT